MKITSHTYANVTSTIYQMDSGDKIPRHRHNIAHTTGVVSGSTEVEIWDEDHQVFRMNPGMSDYILPPEIDHEIRALEDGTVAIHIIEGNGHYMTREYSSDEEYVQPQSGGVILVDGTIVYDVDKK